MKAKGLFTLLSLNLCLILDCDAQVSESNSKASSPSRLQNSDLRILFASSWSELKVMNIDGEQERFLSHGRDPAWSPDGKMIAFAVWFEPNSGVEFKEDNHQIYLMTDDGKDRRNLTNHNGDDRNPAWSPDGKQIAFDSNRDGFPQIYVMNIDGSDLRCLTEKTTTDRDPTWSPDGKRIAYVSGDNNEIYMMDNDGAHREFVTWGLSPSWSPTDGNKIVCFANYRGIEESEIYVVDVTTKARTRITFNTKRDWWPSWTPDGKNIIFVRGQEHESEIFLVDAEGNNERRITENRLSETWPTLSPKL